MILIIFASLRRDKAIPSKRSHLIQNYYFPASPQPISAAPSSPPAPPQPFISASTALTQFLPGSHFPFFPILDQFLLAPPPNFPIFCWRGQLFSYFSYFSYFPLGWRPSGGVVGWRWWGGGGGGGELVRNWGGAGEGLRRRVFPGCQPRGK